MTKKLSNNIFTITRTKDKVEIVSKDNQEIEDLYLEVYLDIILNLGQDLSSEAYSSILEMFSLKISEEMYSSDRAMALSFIRDTDLSKKETLAFAQRDSLCLLNFCLKKNLMNFRESLKNLGLTATLENFNNLYSILLYWHQMLPQSYIYSFIDLFEKLKEKPN